MKKSVTKRIKFRKGGTLNRRRMGIGHNGSRGTKNQQITQKRSATVFSSDIKLIKTALNRVN
ncbi:MAG: hypothetical protein COU11_00955 [Candidatus Harrisonbacteria bacterium CG10_big_fil_rev_8_21_14_0_10_49_15]|uniref:50S ribosomal protein L35 n=1 Tax=Candidatus Harrisonbacteria bacterium CG10_big_fil_rev_8_21_14_0_10_49_15 TaxID=1974587 RepID=A0A2H0ULN6_9BACT|nr:MAG: hypothetical protein COU11_00955 [Candidatus Harrisonbacteria bacterium CG10_big_fil_rev_8_21_14_0_10_49_15]